MKKRYAMHASLHHLMETPLLIAQCCGIFPLRGIAPDVSNKLRFSWCSLRVLMSLILWIVLVYIVYMTWISERIGDTTVTMLNGQLLQVAVPPFIYFPLFLYVSYKWRKFVQKWEHIERRLPDLGSLPNLEFRLKLIAVTFISSRVGYTIMHLIVGLAMSFKCLKLDTFLEHLNTYFLVRYFLMYKVTSPTVWKSVVLFISEIISVMQWVSCSLLITSLSIILAARFRVFNNHMRSNKVQLMPLKYWQDMREAYNCLAQMTSLLDSLLGPLILANFTVETLGIITFIYWAISWTKGPAMYVLVVFGCLKVLLVNIITQFSVAAVYEESKRPLELFSLVPSTSYSKETRRLQDQVATDTLALSGCQFFHVTRAVILTMMSTVVTYEVVLIQFGNNDQPTTSNPSAPLSCINWFSPQHTKVVLNN